MSPTSFDASTFELWGALLHGGRCVLFPGRIATAGELGRVIGQHGINTLWLTASLFNAVVDEAPEVLLAARTTPDRWGSSLASVMSGDCSGRARGSS